MNNKNLLSVPNCKNSSTKRSTLKCSDKSNEQDDDQSIGNGFTEITGSEQLSQINSSINKEKNEEMTGSNNGSNSG